MNFATLLLLTAMSTTLVLRTGERIAVDGIPARQDGLVVFRSGGRLFSLPATEVDDVATKAANDEAGSAEPARKRLKVSAAERERLLRELEQNHSGQPAAPQKLLEEPPTPAEARDTTADEWSWRRQARSYQEALRQAEENVALLQQRADDLRGEIRGFLSLGYKPMSFTYQTTQLAYVEDQIPAARLQVERARRAWDEFRDDARRQGVMPGWLR